MDELEDDDKAEDEKPVPMRGYECRLMLLKGWRLEAARANNVPAYIVVPNKVIEALAKQDPGNEYALESVHGMGTPRITRWGREIVAVLQAARGMRVDVTSPPVEYPGLSQ